MYLPKMVSQTFQWDMGCQVQFGLGELLRLFPISKGQSIGNVKEKKHGTKGEESPGSWQQWWEEANSRGGL